ncbi:MAG: AfsR/SARP family transcriptional regulator, partial [Streptomyces sp.]|nr:AfsR/SARP family transcriptional regulator [Streptomyces sp.]
MEFRVLGPLRVREDSRDHTPTAPKQRQLLSLLLLNAGDVVPSRTCVAELWRGSPPNSAAATLQSYVLSLRRNFTSVPSVGSQPAARRVLETRGDGYSMAVPGETLDLERFRSLARRGSAQLHRDDRRASYLLSLALGVWQGRALDGVAVGPVLSGQLHVLEEEWLSVRAQRIDADLRLGRHRELMEELARLAAQCPVHEYVQAQYMIALYRSGHRQRALDVMARLEQSLREELGLEPSSWVEHLHHAIVRGDSPAEAGRL